MHVKRQSDHAGFHLSMRENLFYRLSKKTEYLWLVSFFLFSEFSAIEMIVFNKQILYLIEDIYSIKSNSKRYFTSGEFESCQFCHALD